MNRITMYALLAASLSLPACNRDATALDAEDRQFIDAIVALRTTPQAAAGDTAAYAAARAAVLSEHDVTEDQLRAYVQKRARDLDRLAAVWESINVRLANHTEQPE